MEKTISNAIKSTLAGILSTIIFGYIFSHRKYITIRGNEITIEMFNNMNVENREKINKVEVFNYKTGLITGCLVTAFLMYIVYDKRNLFYFKNKSK